MKAALCSTVMALAAIFATVSSTEPAPVGAQFAQQIHNATFMERTPDFTDLYVIQTPDKGRLITIYCNASYCYKRRGFTVNV